MFSFMKSKKGFTLVELMIVVVIMAILVAVAVPIFSAVTTNAKKKTCIGNQREIVSALGSWLMLKPTENIAGLIYTAGGQDDPRWLDETITISVNGTNTDVTEEVTGLFKVVPVCPDENANIEIEIIPGDTAVADNAKATVTTRCINGTESDTHLVPGLD